MPTSDTVAPSGLTTLAVSASPATADLFAAPDVASVAASVVTSDPDAASAASVTDRGLRLLHTADWQIGKPYNSFAPDDAVMLAEARFQTVERIAQRARDEAVDAVLVAGDVFDAQGLSDRTIHRLFHSLAAYSGPWLLLPGNHDAALTESIWSRARRLGCVPEHVHLCLAPRVHLFPALKLAILPAPLTQRHTHVDLTDWFAQADTPPGWWRVGLAHGSVQGILADDIDASNPIAPGRAAQAGLDYLALGDWHGTRRIDAHTWYSGTPETDRFRANESGQMLLVTWPAAAHAGADAWHGGVESVGSAVPGDVVDAVDAGVRDAATRVHRGPPTVTPVTTTHFRWRTGTATLHVESDLDTLLADIETLSARDVVQYKVDGSADLAGQRRLQEALDRARGRARSVDADMRNLRLQPTADDIAALHADGYVGDVIAALQDAQQDADPARAACAHDALILLAGMLVPDAASDATEARA